MAYNNDYSSYLSMLLLCTLEQVLITKRRVYSPEKETAHDYAVNMYYLYMSQAKTIVSLP